MPHPEATSTNVSERDAAEIRGVQVARGAPFNPLPLPSNLLAALATAQLRHGRGREILEDQDRMPLSYGRLITATHALGAKLRRMTTAGEVVGVLLPTSVGAAVTLFALVLAGCTPAMLNYGAGAAKLREACALASIKLVLTSQRFLKEARLEGLTDELEGPCTVVNLESIRQSISSLDKIAAAVAARMPLASKAQPDDPAVVLFTSGTTGAPKGVVLTHANLIFNVEQCRQHVEFEPDWIFFNTLPIFHAFGLTGGTLLPLFMGRKAILYPSPLHYDRIPKLVQATRATILISTDTFASNYARSAHADDMSTLKYAVLGAERVRDETRSAYEQKFGTVVLEGYGATECSPVVAVNQPQANRPGTVGRLLPGVEARFEPVPELTHGAKLFLRGPNLMKGYLSPTMPNKIDPPPEGWFDTGDLATLDSDGFLTITGRLKRFARIGAEMISLAAIEANAQRLWPQARHAVVSLASERQREQIVLLTEQPDATLAALRAWCAPHEVRPSETPRRILVIEEIPFLPTGKVDYAAAQRIAEERLKTREDDAEEPA